MNRTLANFAYGAMNRAGLSALARLRHRRQVPVLMYHGVTGTPCSGTLNAEKNHLRAERFERHLEILAKLYRIIPLSELAAALRGGKPLPEGCAALTFDDGYRNNYTTVFPLLKTFNFPATFYLPADPVEHGKPMWVDRLACAFSGGAKDEKSLLALKALIKKLPQSERPRVVEEAVRESGGPFDPPELFAPLKVSEIREMARSSLVDFGSHALTHWPLTSMPLEEARREIVESRTRLQALTGRPIESFSYPHGLWTGVLQSLVEQAGYGSAVIGGLSLNRAGVSPYAILRVALSEEDGDGAVEATLSGLRAAVLAARSLIP